MFLRKDHALEDGFSLRQAQRTTGTRGPAGEGREETVVEDTGEWQASPCPLKPRGDRGDSQ